MKDPIVSVIMACYNSAPYLAETFHSLLAQTFTDFEVIAIDDGSTDNTLAILQQYAQQDERIKVLTQNNTYCVIARQNAIAHAKGKYLVCLDSDDKLAPDYLKKCVAVAESHPDVAIVYSDAQLFDGENKIWQLPEFKLPDFLLTNCIFITALVRKADFDKVGGFDTRLNFLEDWDLFISIVKNGGKVKKIPEILFFYRKRNDQSSVSNLATEKKVSDNMLHIYSKHYDFYKEQKIYFHHLIGAYEGKIKKRKRRYNKKTVMFFYKIFKPAKYAKIYQQYHVK